jgi:phage terminase large subunit
MTWAPHDIEQREIASGLSRKQTAASLGIQFRVVDKIGVDDGIHALRLLLARCWFDEDKCSTGSMPCAAIGGPTISG